MKAAVRAARPGLAGATRDPGVWVLVGAGVVQVLARSPRLHATLLIAAVVVALAEAARGPGGGTGVGDLGTGVGDLGTGGAPPAAPGAAGGPARLLALAALLAHAVALGQVRRYTVPMGLGVTIPALAAVVWAGRVGRGPAGNPARLSSMGVALWLAAVAGLLGWEMAAFAFQPSIAVGSAAHPTLSGLLDPLVAHRAGRTVALFAWALAGWFLLVPARPTTRPTTRPALSAPGDRG